MIAYQLPFETAGKKVKVSKIDTKCKDDAQNKPYTLIYIKQKIAKSLK